MPDQSITQLDTNNPPLIPLVGGELVYMVQTQNGSPVDSALPIGDASRATYLPFFLEVVVSPENSLSQGSNLVTFRVPQFTLTAVRASLSVADSGTNLIIDVKKAGTSIFTTNLLQIDENSRTSVGSTAPANITTTSFADNDEITVNLNTAPTNAAGLKIQLIGKSPIQ